MIKSGFTFLMVLAQFGLAFGQDGYIKGEPALAYWQMGKEKKKPTVVVIHGGPAAQHEYLRPEFDNLTNWANVIYYDQRGCGKSQRADSYLWQEHLSDLKRVVGRFAKRGKVILAGSSWGSTLAIMYAYTYPNEVRGVILTGTYGWEGKAQPFQRSGKVRHNTPALVTLYEHRLIRDTLLSGQTLELDQKISREVEVFYGSPQFETRDSFVSGPPMDSLRKITLPVLIFNGDRVDCTIDKGIEFARVFPHAKLFTIPGACHDPWFSRPDLFFPTCGTFIQALVRRKMQKSNQPNYP